MGWTLSGRNGSGTQYPKLQIWRRSSTNGNVYFRNGPEFQIDAQGSVCEELTRNGSCNQEFHCRLPISSYVHVASGSDIIGVELPPFFDSAFELLFIAFTDQQQYVWRQDVTSFNLDINTNNLTVPDDFLFDADVVIGKWVIAVMGQILWGPKGISRIHTIKFVINVKKCVHVSMKSFSTWLYLQLLTHAI